MSSSFLVSNWPPAPTFYGSGGFVAPNEPPPDTTPGGGVQLSGLYLDRMKYYTMILGEDVINAMLDPKSSGCYPRQQVLV